MIPCFPDPYPGEILYSVWARFTDRVQYPSIGNVLQDLFGNKTIAVVVDLPYRLNDFTKRLPVGHSYTADYFINAHTLLPFYGPFLPQERLNHLREQMLDGDGRAMRRSIGLIGTNIPVPLWIRYCPVCVEEDRTMYGECYWHRMHQVPGVEICHIHSTFLEDSTVRARRQTVRSKEFVSAERAVRMLVSRTATVSPFFKTLADIATDALYLLEHPVIPQGALFIRQQYLALLTQRGFMTSGGKVRTRDFLKAFMNYYPPELLAFLHCEMSLRGQLDSTWLARLTHLPKNAQHPLHHLLTIRFLGSNVEQFLHHVAPLP